MRGAFRAVLDSKCCVMETKLTMKSNEYFTFQTIIGARGIISDAVCVGSPVIIIIYKKSYQTSTQKNLEFSSRVGP